MCLEFVLLIRFWFGGYRSREWTTMWPSCEYMFIWFWNCLCHYNIYQLKVCPWLILLVPPLQCHFLFFALLSFPSYMDATSDAKQDLLMLMLIDSYLYMWMQSNPKLNLLPQQRVRKRNNKWICTCILYAAFWGCPNYSLTDTQLTEHQLVVSCCCNYVLYLLFHRTWAFHLANHWYTSLSQYPSLSKGLVWLACAWTLAWKINIGPIVSFDDPIHAYNITFQ